MSSAYLAYLEVGSRVHSVRTGGWWSAFSLDDSSNCFSCIPALSRSPRSFFAEGGDRSCRRTRSNLFARREECGRGRRTSQPGGGFRQWSRTSSTPEEGRRRIGRSGALRKRGEFDAQRGDDDDVDDGKKLR